MTDTVFLEAAPFQLVDDIHKTAAYYRDVLGFSIGPLFGEPPSFFIAKRNSARLMFRQVRAHEHPGARPNDTKSPETLDIYVWVSDVDLLAAELKARGADIVSAPEDEGGRREMLVRDVNGYLICFGCVPGWPG
jgi:catechol 2,3-dioxygenase-like lactoylglutathione lyase family enzyme